MLKPFARSRASRFISLVPVLAVGLLMLSAASPAQTPTVDTTAKPVAVQPAATKPAATKPAGMQLPADQKAYRAARATKDPDAKIAAFEQFLKDFPDSKRGDAARDLLFDAVLETHPEQVLKIHELAQHMIDLAAAEGHRDYEEYSVAERLARAGTNGVNLKDAERWGKDSVEVNTEAAFLASSKTMYAKYKMPEPPPEETRRRWREYQSSYMQVLANVYYHEGKLDQASTMLDQAYALNPTEGPIYLTRAQIDIAHHHDTDALENLKLADLYGGLTGNTAPLLTKLYAAAHGGSAAGLDAEIDARYKQMFPLPFAPTVHSAPPTGRTVLFELFTGAGCHPCTAADLALDGVLAAYPRSEVIALSYDEHIPEPDPLANADTSERLEFYKAGGTPTAYIDGQDIGPFGGDREEGAKTYKELILPIDKQLGTPSGVELDLHAAITPTHTIEAHANVNILHPEEMKKMLAPAPPAKVADAKAAPVPTSNVEEAAAEPIKLIANCALVQQSVRYSGQNGIRFHSMVVRALAKPSAVGLPIASTGKSSVACNFDPAAISHTLDAYLAAFAKHSERFGETKFIPTDNTLPMDDLAVVAWVEDPATHHILQSAFVAFGKPVAEAAIAAPLKAAR